MEVSFLWANLLSNSRVLVSHFYLTKYVEKFFITYEKCFITTYSLPADAPYYRYLHYKISYIKKKEFIQFLR